MAEWMDVGTAFSVSVDGMTYGEEARHVRLIGNASYFLSLRAGRKSGLRAKLGYVVRAVDAVLDVSGAAFGAGARGSAAIGAMRQPVVVAPVPYDKNANRPGAAPAWATRWSWKTDDTTVPLGLLYPESDNVNSPFWGGFATGGVQFGNPNGPSDLTYTLKITPETTKLKYLVSPKPQWQASAPPALSTGQAAAVNIRVAYPNGEAVEGLRIKLTTLTTDIGLGSMLAHSLVVTTDNAGRASAPVTALRSGGSGVRVELDDPRCLPEFFSPDFYTVLPVNAAVVPQGGMDCVVVPAVAPVPEVPATYSETSTYAWDAGANSVDTHAGDAFVQFSGAQSVIGAVVGFTQAREAVPAPERISHGFYLHTSLGGQALAQVYESGVLKGTALEYTPDTLFRIERAGAAVRYLVDGVQRYRSRVPSAGELSVGASLFATGDYLFEAAGGGEAGTGILAWNDEGSGSSSHGDSGVGAFQIWHDKTCDPTFAAAVQAAIDETGPSIRLIGLAKADDSIWSDAIECGFEPRPQDLALMEPFEEAAFGTTGGYLFMMNTYAGLNVDDGSWYLCELRYQADPLTQASGYAYLYMGGGV